MVRVTLRGVNTVRKKLADGTIRTYHYHRRTGTRLVGELGTPEFIKSFASVSHAPKQCENETLGGIVVAYLCSPEFNKLGAQTKRNYRRHLDHLRSDLGDLPWAALEDRRVRQEFYRWRDGLAATPAAADQAWGTLRMVLGWAFDRGSINVNHATRGGTLYRSNRADIVWEEQAVAAFLAEAPLSLQQALMLALYTGQRQGDILAMGWGHYDGEWLRFRQQKTGTLMEMPVHRDLKAMLDGMEKTATVILTTETGRPWRGGHFRTKWREVTLRAGLDGLHFHDLRGTAATRLQEAGCSDREIAAITGHTGHQISAILDKYVARRRSVAVAAIRKFENTRGTSLQTVRPMLQTEHAKSLKKKR